jgi:hypothetical protein
MSHSRSIVSRSNLLRSWLVGSVKRKVLADQDELFALEAEARKLGLPSSEQAKAVTPQVENMPPNSRAGSDSDSAAEQTAGVSATQIGDSGAGGQPVLLVVDQRTTMRFGARRNSKSVVATKTAAFLAWRALVLEKNVGAIIFDDHKIFQVKPQCTRLRVRLILHALLNQNHVISQGANGGTNPSRLNEVLRRTERVAPANFLIFLISDASGYNEETSCIVKRLAQRNHLVIARVYDPRQAALHLAYSLPAEHSRRRLEGEASEHRTEPHGTGAQMGHWPFPEEVPVVPLNAHINLTEQLHRLWETLTPPTPEPATHSPASHSSGVATAQSPEMDQEGALKEWNRGLTVQTEQVHISQSRQA